MRNPMQHWLTVVFWSVLGLVATGGLLDALTNSLSLKPITIWLAAGVAVSWATLEIFLKFRGIEWTFTPNGQTQKLRALGPKHRAALVGSLFVLVVPHLLPRSGASESATVNYTITDLGTFGGTSSYAYGISDTGAVAGHRVLPSGLLRAFYSDRGNMRDIAVDAGKSGFINSTVAKMNSNGAIVGTTSGDASPFPFVWDTRGGFRRLNFPMFRGVSINAKGHTLLNSSQYSEGSHPEPFVLLPGGQLRKIAPPLGFPNCSMYVTDINDHGTVVGYCLRDSVSPMLTQAFVADAYGTRLLTSPTALSSVANAVNNSGLIAGYVGASVGVGRAVIWEATGIRYLPPLQEDGVGQVNSDAADISESGIVVGTSRPMSLDTIEVAKQRQHRATVWIAEKGYFLDGLIPAHSGWQLIEATGINRVGQIAGYGRVRDEVHAYRLDPQRH